MSEPAITESIPYATPSQRLRPSAAPAVWIALIGLALIGLGGCFCVGITMMFVPQMWFSGVTTPPVFTAGLIEFLIVLHAAAFGCFAGAVYLIRNGVRLLLALMK